MSPKTQIYRILTKKHNLTLKTDALKYLLSQLSDIPSESLDETLEYIAHSYVQKQDTHKLLVDQASLEIVMDSIFRKSALNEAIGGAEGAVSVEDLGVYLDVVDVFTVPQVRWRAEGKQFSLVKEKPSLLSSSNAKSLALRDRYDLLYQRILRHDAFRPSTFTQTSDRFTITHIKNLQGAKPGGYLLFGMLTVIEEGKWHLEDTDGVIELDLRGKIDKGMGLFCQNCFVLIEGLYTEDRILRVRTVGMPVPEPRSKTLSAYGHNVDFFGGKPAVDDTIVLQNIETNMTDVMMVVLSDVHLDQPRVILNLRLLFQGFSRPGAIKPLAFILMGNFMSTPYLFDSTSLETYTQCFNTLSDLLSEFKDLAKTSTFIFIPGPSDPWNGKTVPRPPIPVGLTGKLVQKCPGVKFMSNPCRIKYCTLEMMFFREDLAKTLRRGAILPPLEIDADTNTDIPLERHLVSTLIDQSHLCPLPSTTRPVYWGFDHALRIYPNPHLLVLADKYHGYQVEYEGVTAANPGSFVKDGGFGVFWPAGRVWQTSRVGPL
ncbi:DNA polymerase alpha/epsilon subunit B-domain-containing protein [Phlyctochytrium arcticum]|nr:DNA polymerase alpha/epsilon subunit B-domain-containing protein [Phlyctochytrium arcticum]